MEPRIERRLSIGFKLDEPQVIEHGRWINRWKSGTPGTGLRGSREGYWLRMRIESIDVSCSVSATGAASWSVEARGYTLTKADRVGAAYARSWGRWNDFDTDPMPEFVALALAEAKRIAAKGYDWPAVAGVFR